jgi:hypothetical protein
MTLKTTPIISYKDFNFKEFKKIKIQSKKRGNPGGGSKVKYLDIITAFDIETTRIKSIEQSVMYIWQWQFGDICTVMGRTWEELSDFIQLLQQNMKHDVKLVVFVHNLSYEFQFLRTIYEFSSEEVFAVDSRKVLKCEMYEFLEFRCSYLHSNASLDVYLKNMNVEHKKLDGGEFDYSQERYYFTPLSDKELQYCQNDVLGLVEAISIEMNAFNDNLYTFPLTSTGYVRRDVKKAMRQAYLDPKTIAPDFELYTALREAFRGGNTHANRAYVNMTLHDVSSADRSSSYPDVQCNCLFPVTKFQKKNPLVYDITPEFLLKQMYTRKKAVLFRGAFRNIHLQDIEWGCPYISKDKCRNIVNPLVDNGRILEADYLEITLTDVDFRIVLEEYDFELDIIDMWTASYGKLPKELTDTICGYYTKKTSLKGVAGAEVEYNMSKAKLNSIYGMSAQNPVKQDILFKEFEDLPFQKDNQPLEDLLEYSNKRVIEPYQWGVWTTAWARYRLEEGIKLAGHNFVYCDTDSVKYLGDIDWSAYNEERKADSITSKAHATDPKGEEHYMGVYEFEGKYQEFATLGAKKYVYRKPGEMLEATIAGVSKNVWAKDENGKKYLKKIGGGAELEEHGGIEAFKEGFIFTKAGGTDIIPNDKPEVKEITIDDHIIPIGINSVIKESTYTLGITEEYRKILEMTQEGINLKNF